MPTEAEVNGAGSPVCGEATKGSVVGRSMAGGVHEPDLSASRARMRPDESRCGETDACLRLEVALVLRLLW